LQYRFIEISYALPQIAAHPILGLGLGAIYRPWDPRIDVNYYQPTTWDKRTYIHNGHLWVILKTGILGYLCLLWLMFTFCKRGLQKWTEIPDTYLKGIVLSFTIIFICLFAVALVNPIYPDNFWVPILGIMMGTNEIIYRLNQV